MDITFISIHDLSQDVRVRYASSAVEDVLGYIPSEVHNVSIWNFFSPDELSKAKSVYTRIVRHDKAAGLHYFSLRHKDGHWVRCECVFTVVYDTLVASTSIYKKGSKSEMRAADAPVVRRLFASSRDPRYHMLPYMSAKFTPTTPNPSHEPRAALFLNRFTRSATIIYATPSVSDILGVTPAQLISKSFYYCIAESCLPTAVQCLEGAKANDSIAYLRFWFRNPLNESLDDEMDDDRRETARRRDTHRLSSGSSSSNCSQESISLSDDDSGAETQPPQRPSEGLEVEAILSCTSDGLVVVIRHARPFIPGSVDKPGHPIYANQFASPIISDGTQSAFDRKTDIPMESSNTGGPKPDDLMNTIRDVTVMAWAAQGSVKQ